MEHTGSFVKYENNPVFGSRSTGTMFDAFVRETPNGCLRMDVCAASSKGIGPVTSVVMTEEELTPILMGR